MKIIKIYFFCNGGVAHELDTFSLARVNDNFSVLGFLLAGPNFKDEMFGRNLIENREC